ncbi:hypothetical protein GDO86_003374 [Hymenochirus boettgeri]|uniref:LIM zinc-binding domain-containing protein n=1 Tax=Hymenochirus boettgeri TaxID=247094 RepID=A0A8T2K981_9PIPI|nr:hypothetical protein GDO86_003374 [Hymenochirus boettgeri]
MKLFHMAPETPAPALNVTPTNSSSDSDSGCALEDFSDLEVSNFRTLTLPVGDIDELKVIKTLLQLLPPQDCDERFCTALGEHELRELQIFSTQRRLQSIRHGVTVAITLETADCSCVKCHGQITVGDTAVLSEQVQEDGLCWHVECFVCETCHLPLMTFIYFLHDGKTYCGRHHAELSRSRCAACDQLILSEQCVVAEGHCWHMEHFCCWECDRVLGGSQYMMKGGRPFCKSCFLCLYSDNCETCGEPIDPDEEIVAFMGQYWHSKPPCFSCTRCRTSLQGSEFMVDDGQIYCSPCGSIILDALTNQKCLLKNTVKTQSPEYSHKLNSSHHDYTANLGSNISLKSPPSATIYPKPCFELNQGVIRNEEVSQLHVPCYKFEEDAVSYTSSSTDSEPEGFFLGTLIPKYSKQISSPVFQKNSFPKKRYMRKSCKVS